LGAIAEGQVQIDGGANRGGEEAGGQDLRP
jgi:hypothetical protein